MSNDTRPQGSATTSSTSYKDAPTRTVTAGGVDFAYRELGPKSGVPVIFLTHLAANLDNWDPRVVDGIHRWGRQQPADLSVIEQPVLVANGDNDRMVPTSNTVDLDRRLPNSELVIYPDAGHGGIFQNHHELVATTLAFLDR